MPSVIALSVFYAECRSYVHNAECRYGECLYGECRGAKFSTPDVVELVHAM